jgi:hypothetical protein
MSAVRSPAAEYLRFLALVVAVAAVLALLGFAPTRRIGGEEALPAMLAGILIGAVASAIGGLPVLMGRRSGNPAAPLQGMLGGMGARLAAVVALGLSAGLSGWFEARPLLIWIALGYVAQLPLEVRYATRGI